jgi:hypothetical protein
MTTTHRHRRIGSLVIAAVLVVQISPAVAGPNEAPTPQGSLVPGLPVSSTDAGTSKDHRALTITFTKWITQVVPADPVNAVPRRFLMAGFTGGDVDGDFVGEALHRQVSLNGRVIWLEAMYEIQAGDHSFTALIRGGTGETTAGEPASVSGAALLDGVILSGWRTGAKVHVAFQTTTNCPGAPTPGTCFQGTITVSQESGDQPPHSSPQ